ncbi:IS630 family transposase [Spirulina sp. 06S082]|uniref:IS630 family transposase n=1 Tax=Spirulina sp. 06S082 TaxID=3110248 RepID=UPI002B1FF88F|nr:IS630 family transposase [Spirulina sp. 06S082]MEA5470575.1 IS630 family transposase [Spirulina sp. 06S082]
MRYVKGLSQETLKILKRIWKESKYPQVRQRAHCIQLSDRGYKIAQLIETSKETIKRVIKRLKMGWYRIKKRVGGEPHPQYYERKIEELEELKRREARGEIEIKYGDESGFCLVPYVPYAWQEASEKIEIKSQQSSRLNVLGFMSRNNQLDAYIFQCSINSDVVVACLDALAQKIKKETYVVLDNSSIHQNNWVWNKEEEWKEKGLHIFFLPNYSPHLNIIEILWRFMKYKWLDSEAYENFKTLVEKVEEILINFGTKYTINFA